MELRQLDTAMRFALRRFSPAAARTAPGLDRPVVLSLTSYPPRFPTLAATLRALMLQETRPDNFELWIAEVDAGRLPRSVLGLRRHGLAIRTTDDLGPHKKFLPAREAHPEAIIVTADDDQYYPPGWLEALLCEYRPGVAEVICLRAHRIVLGSDGRPLPYADWQQEIAGPEASPLIFPTGVGGVLYPPEAHAPQVIDRALIRRLCPTADDVWLYFMARLAGTAARKAGFSHRVRNWHASQQNALEPANRRGGNDQQVAAMIAEFGFPG